MPLDPETIAAIQQAIKDVVPAVVAESVKPISEQLELVQHNNAKLAESVSGLSQSIPEQIDGKFSAITPKLDYLEQLKLKQESEEADKPKKQTEIQKAISEVSGQYEQQLSQFRQELEAEKAEAAKLRESDRQSRMRNDVLATMRGMKSIIPGTEEQVLILLESQGLIVEDGDKLRIKTEDRFKQPVNADFGEALPLMLEK